VRPPERRTAVAVVTGALSGVAGALLFAAAHAVLIVAIWGRITSGVLFAMLAGGGAGWAFAEFYPAAISRPERNAMRGAAFGALLWLSAAPVTVADAIMRALGMADRFELVLVVVALLLAISGGALLGWLVTRRRRGMMAGAAATLLLTIATAGPVPVARSVRAFSIFLAVLPAAVLGGLVLAVAFPLLFRLVRTDATADA
jgi:hypothetical protein